MSSLAFTIDWGDQDDKEDQSSISASSLDYMPEPRRAVSDSQVKSTAWEISVSGQTKSKKQFIPKFLRDYKQNSQPTDVKGQPSDCSATPGNVRSIVSPLKAKGSRLLMKSVTSPSPLKYVKVPTKSKSSDSEVSPKKQLPAIRKPLLPVTSPTKKPIRSPEIKSQSECLLSSRTSNKALKGVLDHTQSRKKTQLQSSSQLLGASQRQRRMNKGEEERRVRETQRDTNAETRIQAFTLVSDEPSSSQPRLAASPRDIAQRKVLDLKRWYCICRPQYSKSCGISSVVSCWNYLFSILGNGNLPPLTQEEALGLLGFEPPFGEIRFGHYTGNVTCMRWFQQLCGHFGTSGHGHYFYKPVGRRRTVGVKPSMALEKLQEGLKSSDTTFIYHCYNHYFCPIGYEQVPKLATHAYSVDLAPADVNTWILIGEPSRNHPVIHCKRWFQQLCGHFGTSGHGHYFYKPVGRRRTVGVKPSMALEKLQEGLKSSDTTFIYHCYNHYFCPIGYEQVPKLATHAYSVDLAPADVNTWILIGEPSRNHPVIHCKRWDDVVKDLTCEMPKYFNIRHTERGIVSKNSKRTGKNLHCIMAFKKLQDSLINVLFDNVDSEDDMSLHSEIEELDSSDSDASTSAQDFSSGVLNYDENKSHTADIVGERRLGDYGDILPPVVPDQSDTFTNFPALCSMHQGMSSSDSDCNAEVDCKQDQNDIDFATGVRRSNTFTKERPTTLNVQQIRPPSPDLDSDYSLDAVDDTNVASIGMTRSSTYTKDLAVECIVNIPTVTSRDEDAQCCSRVLKKSVHAEDDDVDIDLQNIDLDETLKSSDFI